MAPVGIEPKTFALLARRSNQLSYGACYTMRLFGCIFILEQSPEHEYVVTDDITAPKKSTSRKKRRSKLSTKKSSEKSFENSPRFYEDQDPDFFPDPNLRLALQSLRVRLNCVEWHTFDVL